MELFLSDETVIQTKIALLDKNLPLTRDKKAAPTLKKFFCRSHSQLDYTILWKLFANAGPIAIIIEKYEEHASIIVIEKAFPCQLYSFEVVDNA